MVIKSRFKFDRLDLMSFMNGLVFYSPVALLVRTTAGVSESQFFVLQALLSLTILIFEIPTGKWADRIGCKNTLVISQISLCSSKILLFAAYIFQSLTLFFVEVFVEGLATCLFSGTQSAYIYNLTGENQFLEKTAHVNNCGTLGFVISTSLYVVIYRFYGISGLLLATIVSSAMGVYAAAGLKKADIQVKRQFCDSYKKNIAEKILNLKSVWILLLLSLIDIGLLLVNFFYVEKLKTCGLSELFLTPIILGYSAIQLLSESILRKFRRYDYLAVFTIFYCMAAISIFLFGFISGTVAVIMLMLTIPLLIDLPLITLEGIQNKFIDELQLEQKRAELISVFNMGVNLIEVIFLFVSAAIAGAGVSLCFKLLGVAMMISGIFMYKTFRRIKT